MAWAGWADYRPRGAKPSSNGTSAAPRQSRGAQRGARWAYVTPDGDVIDYAQHHAQGGQKRADWLLFHSKAEAHRWIALLEHQGRGVIKALRRQVRFALQVKNQAGLAETIGHYVADFVYLEDGYTIVEDKKPSGGHREDLYLWKRKHFEAQYGITIRET